MFHGIVNVCNNSSKAPLIKPNMYWVSLTRAFPSHFSQINLLLPQNHTHMHSPEENEKQYSLQLYFVFYLIIICHFCSNRWKKHQRKKCLATAIVHEPQLPQNHSIQFQFQPTLFIDISHSAILRKFANSPSY